MNLHARVIAGMFLAGTVAASVAVILHEKSPQRKTTMRRIPRTGQIEKLPVDITLRNLKGRPVSFSHWKSHLLLINFWAPWCLPCREEVPALIKAQKKYGRLGFRVVAIAVDNPSAARRGSRLLGITYPVLVSQSPTKIIKLMDELGNNDVDGIPFSILISPNGSIIERYLGALTPTGLDKLIAKNLRPS